MPCVCVCARAHVCCSSRSAPLRTARVRGVVVSNRGHRMVTRIMCVCARAPPPQDTKLYDAVQEFGEQWVKVSSALVSRTPRQCSDRWRRYGSLLAQERSGEIVRDRNKRAGGLPVTSTPTFMDPGFDETVKAAALAQLRGDAHDKKK